MKSFLYSTVAGMCAPVIVLGQAISATGRGVQVAGKVIEEGGNTTQDTARRTREDFAGRAARERELAAVAREEAALDKLATTKMPADTVVEAVLRRLHANAAREHAVDAELTA